jgi:homoserine O-succinyltransferase/O-acetyltransferase
MIKPVLRAAILDLYDGQANQGMRCIKEMLEDFGEKQGIELDYDVYDIRGKEEIPTLEYDVYISTGGPGSPIDSEGTRWEALYFSLMDNIRQHNYLYPEAKKYVFLICHSFQIYARHYKLGNVNKRVSTSFGVMPIHKTLAGTKESLLNGLADPFWAVDSRDWQVTQPDLKRIRKMGGEILCIEKYRPHVKLERCVMAMRFDDAIFGTQFHPEADSAGMLFHMKTEDKKKQVIEQHGEEKYYSMIDHLDDPEKIVLTHQTIIPLFLQTALQSTLQKI